MVCVNNRRVHQRHARCGLLVIVMTDNFSETLASVTVNSSLLDRSGTTGSSLSLTRPTWNSLSSELHLVPRLPAAALAASPSSQPRRCGSRLRRIHPTATAEKLLKGVESQQNLYHTHSWRSSFRPGRCFVHARPGEYGGAADRQRCFFFN